MLTSSPCTELLSALLAARLAFPPITRNCEAWSPKSKKTYLYADQNAIIDATVPVLGAHGVLVVQAPEDGESGLMCVTTTLFHVTSGQWMRSTLSFERLSNPQDAGSQITYYKRYGLAGILSLSTETDDDASSLNVSSKAETPAAVEQSRPAVPVNGNGHTPPAPEPDAGLEHPTEGHLAALRKLAVTVCMEEPEVFEQRIRQVMGLKPQASVSPRLLTRTQTMAQYMTLFQYYRNLEAQLAKSRKEAHDDGAQPGSTQSDVSPAETAPTEDPTPAPQPGTPGPSSAVASGSAAPEPGAAERDRVRLREEVAQWDLRVSVEEQEFIITRHPYSKARQLLWRARREPEAALAS